MILGHQGPVTSLFRRGHQRSSAGRENFGYACPSRDVGAIIRTEAQEAQIRIQKKLETSKDEVNGRFATVPASPMKSARPNVCRNRVNGYRLVPFMGSAATVADGTEAATESWQITRVKAAAARHPVSDVVTARLVAAMEAEMMAKQLSAGELDRLAAELLAGLEESPR
jgi:hypothetical protein